MKTCSRCKTIKKTSRFRPSNRYKDGYENWCLECKAEYSAAHYQKNKEAKLAKEKARREENPELHRDSYLRRTYNITLEQYNEMLVKQNYGCAICGRTNDSGYSLAVDHDHKCCPGKTSCGECVRGLLCSEHNAGIGYFDDDIDEMAAAMQYILQNKNILEMVVK